MRRRSRRARHTQGTHGGTEWTHGTSAQQRVGVGRGIKSGGDDVVGCDGREPPRGKTGILALPQWHPLLHPPLSSLCTPAPLDCNLPTICLLTCTLLFCPAVLLAAASIRLHLQWWLPRHVCAPCRQCCLGGNSLKSLGCACRSWVWQAPAGTKRSPVGGMVPLMPVMWKARRANTARDVRAVEASAEHTLKGRYGHYACARGRGPGGTVGLNPRTQVIAS